VATLTSKRLAGVEVRSDTDGCGSCNGYATTFDSCTCYDFQTKGGSYDIAGRQMCKHIFALYRVTPCRNPNGCSGLMILNVQPAAASLFECACGWTVDPALVRDDRNAVVAA